MEEHRPPNKDPRETLDQDKATSRGGLPQQTPQSQPPRRLAPTLQSSAMLVSKTSRFVTGRT